LDDRKVSDFIQLAGQNIGEDIQSLPHSQRALGAQLLLSEVLEYIVHGLGLAPVINGQTVTDPNDLKFEPIAEPDKVAMLDGLADTAYTMYWNSLRFGMPLEKAFEAVCDNNLEKFVRLPHWAGQPRPLESNEWHCNQSVTWPPEVVEVSVVAVSGSYFAVGKDNRGKVRKPSTYRSVELEKLLKSGA